MDSNISNLLFQQVSDSCLSDFSNFEFKEDCLKYVTKDLHSLSVIIIEGKFSKCLS